nr:hypothetical protein [uncultured Draconibacterium sp.]
MIKIRQILIIALFTTGCITCIHLYMLNTQKKLDQKSKIIENLNKERGKLLETIYCSNIMIGKELNDCTVSSISGNFLLSNLLTNDINYIFRFSNTNCFDCLKDQVEILKTISNSKEYLLITKFGNNRQIKLFGEQIEEAEIYNISSRATLFKNEDDGLPLVAVINSNFQILAMYYCDKDFMRFHEILIP